MATKRRRVKRRKTKRRQRGGAAPSKEGEKFKLTVDKTEIWDTLEDVTYPAKKSKTLTPEVAKSSKDDIVEFTGKEYSPNYVMKTTNGKFIKAKEAELEKVPVASTGDATPPTATVPTSDAGDAAGQSTTTPTASTDTGTGVGAATGDATPPTATGQSTSSAATPPAAVPAAVPDAGDAEKIAELEKKLKDNWNCDCKQKTPATGGKKSRKRKNKKRARKNTRTKKRR